MRYLHCCRCHFFNHFAVPLLPPISKRHRRKILITPVSCKLFRTVPHSQICLLMALNTQRIFPLYCQPHSDCVILTSTAGSCSAKPNHAPATVYIRYYWIGWWNSNFIHCIWLYWGSWCLGSCCEEVNERIQGEEQSQRRVSFAYKNLIFHVLLSPLTYLTLYWWCSRYLYEL